MDMNETELTQMADFLDIAIEEIERRNDETALDFVEDVRDQFKRDEQDRYAENLDTAVDCIINGEYSDALDAVGDVYKNVLDELAEMNG